MSTMTETTIWHWCPRHGRAYKQIPNDETMTTMTEMAPLTLMQKASALDPERFSVHGDGMPLRGVYTFWVCVEGEWDDVSCDETGNFYDSWSRSFVHATVLEAVRARGWDLVLNMTPEASTVTIYHPELPDCMASVTEHTPEIAVLSAYVQALEARDA